MYDLFILFTDLFLTNSYSSLIQIESLLDEIHSEVDLQSLPRLSENRALPLRNTQLEMTRKKNLKLSKPSEKSKEAESESNTSKADNSGGEAKAAKESKPEKTVQRRLYDILFSPVEDILSKLPKESSLIVIPDKALCHCPFNVLQDFLNRYSYSRFHITIIPSLLVLDRVVANELSHLRALDDLEFERQLNRKGGVLNAANRYILLKCFVEFFYSLKQCLH